MKKSISILLISLLLLLAGCGTSTPAATEADAVLPTETGSEAVTVRTAEELIAAVKPGAVISIEGTIDLSSAPSYGQRSGNPYVKWEDVYEGYQLQIHDVDDLTICGNGKNQSGIQTDPRIAFVLSFEDCTGIRLEDFTAGHTVQADGCSAGVIALRRCDDVTLSGLGLFGCGTIGVDAWNVIGLNASDLEIYDCSSGGMNLYSSSAVRITDCSFHNIGKMQDGFAMGYSVVNCNQVDDLEMSGCSINNNTVSFILGAFDSGSIRLRSSRIQNNSASEAIWNINNSDVTVESTVSLSDNTFSRWYPVYNEMGLSTNLVHDENGVDLHPEEPAPLHTLTDSAEPVPVITTQQKQVKAATVDEFLKAIDSDTEIILTGTFYDLSTAKNYGKDTDHYIWVDNYDGPGLVIRDVKNFSILGDGEDPAEHTISAVPRYAEVITFQDCENILVKGFTAGHTVEPGTCMGGVLYFNQSRNCLVENCNLYGCGVMGVKSDNSADLQIFRSQIYECSDGGIFCYQTCGVTVSGCEFRDLGGSIFQFFACDNITVNGKSIDGNYYGD